MFCDPAGTDEKEIFHKVPRRPQRREIVCRNPRRLAGAERCIWEASRDSLAVRAAARGFEATQAGGLGAGGAPRGGGGGGGGARPPGKRISEREFTSRECGGLGGSPGDGGRVRDRRTPRKRISEREFTSRERGGLGGSPGDGGRLRGRRAPRQRISE